MNGWHHVGAGPCACPDNGPRACPSTAGQPQGVATIGQPQGVATIGQPQGVAPTVSGKILPQRKSIRLKNYDYSSAGFYFVTICTKNRVHLFGEIVDGKMNLNDAGTMVQTIWDEIPQYYPGIEIDAFQIMPNHIHGIIIIDDVGAGPCACPNNAPCGRPSTTGQPRGVATTGQPRGVAPTGLSLPDIVHRLKTMTTKRYIDGVKQRNWRRFSGKLWQRNYWEHIVRNENELNRIRQYIKNNPRNWQNDKLNGGPGNVVMESTQVYGEEIWMV